MLNLDWNLIQKRYDEGASFKVLEKEFGCSTGAISYAIKNGKFKGRTKAQAAKIAKRKTGPLSPETKDKLSLSLKKAHLENRHPGWKSVNINKERRTYPEQKAWELIEKNNLTQTNLVVEKLPVGRFFLDFAFTNQMIDLEIDGQYHIFDEKTIQKDKRRDEWLEQQGWKVYRISWMEMIKNQDAVFAEFISFLASPSINARKYDSSIIIKMYSRRSKIHGGKEQYSKYRRENYIPKLNKRKIERPTLNVLLMDVEENGFLATGRKYGVSDNAIRKWIKSYQKDIQCRVNSEQNKT